MLATKCYLAIGANVDPEKNILRALALLHESEAVSPTRTATFYRTAPLGDLPQADFLNGVWEIETGLSPRELKFGVLREIEKTLGRSRSADSFAAREIDLDILLYGDQVIAEHDLTIPDPDIPTRIFIAAPLFELTGDILLPGGLGQLNAYIDSDAKKALDAVEGFTQQLRERMTT